MANATPWPWLCGVCEGWSPGDYWRCTGCGQKRAYVELRKIPARLAVPYPGYCHRLPECFGRASCPRDISCID